MAASGVGKRVLIGGASGFVGRNLCRELTDKGYQAIALTGRPQDLNDDIEKPWTGVCSWVTRESCVCFSERMPAFMRTSVIGKACHITILSADQIYWSEFDPLTKKAGFDAVDQAVADCDAVVNLAGTPIIALSKRWTPAYRHSVVRSRIDTTHTLTEAIRKADKKPSVFVCASAVSYYPPSPTRASKQFDERVVCKPYDFLSDLCHQWEESAAAAQQSGVRTVSVRTGVALGRSGGMIANMFWPFFAGFGGPIGNGRQPLPWIHVHDLAGIYIQAIEDESIDGPINATAPADNSFGEFAQEFGRAMWRPALLPLPEFVVRAVFSDERAVMFTKGQRVVPRKALDTKYEFIYPDLKTACQSVARVFTTRELTG